jgi:hypothetical protein
VQIANTTRQSLRRCGEFRPEAPRSRLQVQLDLERRDVPVGTVPSECDAATRLFAQALAKYPVKCVVLNACSSIANLTDPISPITIGMDAAIADEAAVEFSRGFYDALANGKNFSRAFDEGRTALKLKGYDDLLVKMIARSR